MFHCHNLPLFSLNTSIFLILRNIEDHYRKYFVASEVATVHQVLYYNLLDEPLQLHCNKINIPNYLNVKTSL